MTGGALMPYDPEKLKRDEARVLHGVWDKIRRHAGRIPFLEEAVAAYYCAIDRATPLQVKAVLLGALAYFIMPIDILPDFMAVLGFTDDAAVLVAAVKTVLPHIRPEHHDRARAAIRRLAGDQAPAGGTASARNA
jgi:uncharacterized membrane protein YkvA (DUF1232 family)